MTFNTNLTKCLFAYPSEPSNIAEIMMEASENINLTNSYEVLPWPKLNVGGNIVISQICNAIDQSEVFICDLTHLNPNVLFELGYAIAKRKFIWPIMDVTIESAKKEFQDFGILTTIGYTQFRNTSELVTKFFDADLNSKIKKDLSLYDQLLNLPIQNVNHDERTIFYLKNFHPTESSIKLTQRLKKSPIKKATDDPTEVARNSFAWYAQHLAESFAVVTHFSDKKRIGAHLHNAKQALIGGIAHGLDRKLLMIADAPYHSPVDYRDLLVTASTSRQAILHLNTFLSGVEGEYFKNESTWKAYTKRQSSHSGLQRLSMGDYVAENEAEALLDYYVPTSTLGEILNSQQTIFIGRKGAGKTATLFKLEDEFKNNKQNHVCIIKPEGYDFEGLIDILKKIRKKSETGYLIESLWKYLLYSELVKSMYDELKKKPDFYEYSDAEEKLNTFCVDHEDIICTDFASRLDIAIQQLTTINSGESTDRKLHISELLHTKHISPMREILSELFSRTARVVVLIDNLDSAWIAKPSEELGDLLWGLLATTQTISIDLNRGLQENKKILISTVLFLRSDIFHQLSGYAREKDKISHSTLSWNDKEKLINVIEKRLQTSIKEMTPDQIWINFFCKDINKIPLKDYIVKYIIPRPRDIIYLIKAAIAEAVNRGHAIVEDTDFISAKKKYSEYALESVLSEYVEKAFDLEGLFYSLIGQKKVLTHSSLVSLMDSISIPKENHDTCLKSLLELSLLGVEVQEDDFRFVFERAELKKFQIMSRLYSNEKKAEARYKINYPFLASLDIK